MTKGSVVVVDDTDVGESMQGQLEALGYEVVAVAAGWADLSPTLGERRPDAVLVNLSLAGGQGPQTGRRLLELGIPVVYVTDGNDAELLEASKETDPLGYVVMPVDSRQLDLNIEAAVSMLRFRRELASNWSDGSLHTAQEAMSATQASDFYRRTRLMETVFNSIADGLAVADSDGNFVAVNKRGWEITGGLGFAKGTQTQAESYGLFLGDGQTLCPTDQRPLVRALLGESTDDFPMVLRNAVTPQGVAVLVSARPLYDSGAVNGALVIFRDVTGVRRTEDQLRRTTNELREQTQALTDVLNTISDGVVVADEDGHFTVFNPSAERIVGTGAADIPTDQWSDHYGIFYSDQVTKIPEEELPLVRAINGHAIDEQEVFVRNPAIPRGAFISVNGRPITDASGNVKGGVVTFRDVTERRRTAQALSEAFAQGRLEVLGTILHNIGNAINSVAVGVDTLGSRLGDDTLRRRLAALTDALHEHRDDLADYLATDPQGRHALPFMRALAEDMAQEKSDLKATLERVENRVHHIVEIIRAQRSFGHDSTVRTDLAPRDVIDDAVNVVLESFERHKVDLAVECSNVPELIRVDASRFNQMLVNLLSNAIEAIDERRRFDGHDELGGRVQIRCYTRDESLVIDVVDNGIGIDPDQMAPIFELGYTTKDRGSGLGLHSTANFVSMSGGRIEPISDGKGQGATMRLSFRLATLDPAEGGDDDLHGRRNSRS